MQIIKRNKDEIQVVNILVYAENCDVLWKYRDLLYGIENRIAHRLELTLTCQPKTVLEVIEFLHGELDFYISDHPERIKALDFLEWKIHQKYPECRIVVNGLQTEKNLDKLFIKWIGELKCE